MNVPLVSVVIPTYNYGHFLAEAIQSVLEQTFRDFEIIVVDDGSTDNTREVIEQFGDSVRYIHQNNQGVAVARNNGIKAARGQYIAFLDADDLWLPQKLQLQTALFEECPHVGLVYSTVYLFESKSGAIVGEYPVSCCRKGKVLRDLYMYPFIPSPTPLIPKDVFNVVGCFDNRFDPKEDSEMWLRIAARYEFAFVPKPLAKYRLHGSIQSKKGYEKGKRIDLAILEKVGHDYPNQLWPLRLLRLATYEEEFGWELIRRGERSSGISHLKRAIRYIPWRVRPYLLLAFAILWPSMTPERSRQSTLNYFWAKHSLFNHNYRQARVEFFKTIVLDPLTYPKAYIGLLLTFAGKRWVDKVRSKICADRYLITRRPDQDAVFGQL
jgi:glycosyltransferase involved in cell wall biosynthesis